MNSEKTLFLFTIQYPFGIGEEFLENELRVLSSKFKKIYVFPIDVSGAKRYLPENAEIITWWKDFNYDGKNTFTKNSFLFFKILFKEFYYTPDKKKFIQHFSELRSSFLQNLSRADHVSKYIKELADANSIFYSFWFDDWATVLGIIKEKKIIDCYCSRTHGFDLYEERRKNGFFPLRNFQLRSVKRIFAACKDGARYLNKKHPQYSPKFQLSHLGVFDQGENPFTTGETLILVSCSALIPLKRVHLIIESLKKVKVNVQWIHFGGGNQKEELMKLSEQLPAHIKVEFKGHVQNSEILDFYKTNPVHLFIHLSETEGGVPVSLQEAASFGIPLLGTNVGGVPEIVTEETGMLIPADVKTEEVARFINEFKNSFRNTLDFRHRCRKFWENNFEANKNYEHFYKQLTEAAHEQ